MDNKVIVPWDEKHGDSYVPKYIKKRAKQALKQYPFSVKKMRLITTKPDKGGAIWKLQTSSGPKSLKLLHRRPTRSLFSLEAQNYLTRVQNANAPSIVKTKKGADYIELGGKLWFVAEWIEPLKPVSKDLKGAKKLCSALGRFHRLSKGYVPPAGSEVPSRLYKWPKKYEKIIEKMDWFRNIAKAYPEMPASQRLLRSVDRFEKQAIKGYERLMRSSYQKLASKGNEYWGLVHQDFGWSNCQRGPGGMWIIDLDGVAYDFPIRDLTKLISGTMADLGQWDVKWIREMIKAYHKENPISPELYELILIELSMPDQFYKNMKEVVYEPQSFLNKSTDKLIKQIVKVDKTKWPALKKIKDDWKRGMKK